MRRGAALARQCQEMQARLEKRKAQQQAQAERQLLRDERRREWRSWQRMGASLWVQERALQRERYITALYSIPSNWCLVERAGLYYAYSTFDWAGKRRRRRMKE
jgi:hypothetical protein